VLLPPGEIQHRNTIQLVHGIWYEITSRLQVRPCGSWYAAREYARTFWFRGDILVHGLKSVLAIVIVFSYDPYDRRTLLDNVPSTTVCVPLRPFGIVFPASTIFRRDVKTKVHDEPVAVWEWVSYVDRTNLKPSCILVWRENRYHT